MEARGEPKRHGRSLPAGKEPTLPFGGLCRARLDMIGTRLRSTHSGKYARPARSLVTMLTELLRSILFLNSPLFAKSVRRYREAVRNEMVDI